jgi:ATP-dependent Lon protease
MLLDEIDKIGADQRGDPAAALLEVLDPQQNQAFRDHYLGLPLDLSRVMFLATANLIEPIAPAFQDRLEIIWLSGYTANEKQEIATRHILPRQMEENGLTPRKVSFSGAALRKIINGYTREAGLRGLEREVGSVCRKVARKVAEGRKGCTRVSEAMVEELLGLPKVSDTSAPRKDRVGVAVGLAWTATGGEILDVEASAMPGRGNLILTGHLGDVMKESARAAQSYARARSAELGLEDSDFSQRDVHIHVPEGAIPKDGPSAGITMAAALISALTGRPLRRDLAMTGEITLRGDVLAVGGIKEKVLAARRAGLRRVLLPEATRRQLEDLPEDVRAGLEFIFAGSVSEVLEAALRPAARTTRRAAGGGTVRRAVRASDRMGSVPEV